MPNKVLATALIGIVFSVAFLLLKGPERERTAEPRLTNQRIEKSEHNSEPYAKWLSRHDAGITIHQSSADGGFNRGTIKVGSLIGDLGEAPPRYIRQLKAGKFKLLLGEKDDRNSFRRYATIVWEENNFLAHDVQVTVTWTKWAPAISAGGFVFRRDENEISHLGIIIPDIESPLGSPVDLAQYSVDVRLENPVRYIDLETLASLIAEPLDGSRIVIMPTLGEEVPKSACVLWLKIGDDTGSLEIINSNSGKL